MNRMGLSIMRGVVMDTKTNLKALTNQEVPLNNKFKSIAKKLINIKVGVLPLPLYLILAAIIFVASIYNTLPADMIGGFAVIMILGILLGDLGQKIPILKDIGGPAILALLVPSILVFLNVIHSTSMEAVTTLMKTSNFLYFYISCLVVGSILFMNSKVLSQRFTRMFVSLLASTVLAVISCLVVGSFLGMNSKVLIQGFTRMFVPLLAGTVLAVTAGLFVVLLLGYDIKHTLFYIVVPIIGGGIGEGILPLSIAYSSILGDSAESFVSQMIPAAVTGNIFAVVTAGVMMRVGEKYTKLSGNGKLIKSESTEESIDNKKEKDK